jgi:flagellum-specific peptidoglycan hydrolase FlgJ
MNQYTKQTYPKTNYLIVKASCIIILLLIPISVINNKTNIDYLKYKTFSPELLIELLIECDIKNYDIVFKQSILETGHFTSDAFKTKNNLFGISNMQGLVTFNSWEESVYRYKAIQKNYKKGCYYTFLEEMGYAEDSLYINKLKHINSSKYFKQWSEQQVF